MNLVDESIIAQLNLHPIMGVRYNVVRRPLSGGKGSIKKHAAKCTKEVRSKKDGRVLHPSVVTPEETDAEFYERLRRDYLAAEPDYWFFRVLSRVGENDIINFRRQFLFPVLENLCDDFQWWDHCLRNNKNHWNYLARAETFPDHKNRHYREPFGVWDSLSEGGSSEYDHYLETGGLGGLTYSTKLFPEL